MSRHTPAQSGDRRPQAPAWRVLFVCLGNICRSPLAKGVFIHTARQRGVLPLFEVDSCGTGGWHVGEGADPRAAEVARRHGVPLEHCARQLAVPHDFERFDLLIGMDRSNLENILRAGGPRERARLLREFENVPGGTVLGEPAEAPDVPDPYYGGRDGFEQVYQMVRRSCEGLLEVLLAQRPRG